MLDEALVLWFPGPKSFTGENVVEFHVHGSHAIVRAMNEALGTLEAFRPAEAGEFARRAFANDQLDLTAVEGLADLVNADTDAQRRQALRQMRGQTATILEGWRAELLRCLAHVEAVIDFGEDEEDVSEDALQQAATRAEALACRIRSHLRDGRRGELVRQGVRVALVGPPNAGKSSLLNCLARRPAAIVSDIPGTTRDVVEVQLDLAGLAVVLSDTAGMRAPSDPIEQQGVARALDQANHAHIVILVLDGATFRSDPEEWHRSLEFIQRELPAPTLILLNKRDVWGGEGEDGGVLNAIRATVPTPHALALSCETEEGLEIVLEQLQHAAQVVVWGQEMPESDPLDAEHGILITRERHRHHLTECQDAIQRFLAVRSHSVDLAAEDLRLAANSIGRITGRVDVEELLDIIFGACSCPVLPTQSLAKKRKCPHFYRCH